MSRLIMIFSLILTSFGVYSQDSRGVKKIVTFNYGDTLEIKKFNKNGDLIFQKIFPQYGISQIIGYNYDGKEKVSHTWSHSNIGFVETEFEFDSLKNTILAYSFTSDGKIPIKKLMSYHSLESLKSSKEFKKYYRPDNRYLKSVKYLNDSVVFKEDEYSENGKKKSTTYFTYNNGKLSCEKKVDSHDENRFQELMYEYDDNGNEIKWAKIYKSTDTSIVYTKRYDRNNLVEELGYIKSELDSKTIYEYQGNLLKSKKQFNNKGELKIQTDYNYGADNRVASIVEVNKYMGHKKKIMYYYWK